MKKANYIYIIAFLCFNLNAQISFEKGYYINNSNVRIDCLIKNMDWLNNPDQFSFKLSNDSKERHLDIGHVKEFGIHGVSKYVKAKVNIDKSSDNKNSLSSIKSPVFNEEILFLKVLFEGKVNLYSYQKSGLKRFFFSEQDKDIKQLVYKKYLVSNYNIGTNNQFRQQIKTVLGCPGISLRTIQDLQYNKASLISIFKKYHKCIDSSYNSYESKERKGQFNLTLRPRLNSSNLNNISKLSSAFQDYDFETKLNFAFGIELENILSFNNNKWSLIAEPTYRSSSFEGSVIRNPFDLIVGQEISLELDFSSIEIPLGLRHYFFLNADSKLFLNASVVIDIILNSSLLVNSAESEIKSSPGIAFGLGYQIHNKYSLEFRYHEPRNLTDSLGIGILGDYETISLIFGYKLF
ncbi:tRNA modification GTPase [Seonamhaeicola sp.]|uniref:tRNA modification GTPase n=1 Tax=Seonamhaeicola sp. TaxID=1912245 RepID=UPI002613F4BA|nr:tRNA modification GTPase [Seonamhaeicola sp.]